MVCRHVLFACRASSHQVVLAANWAEHAAGSSPRAAEQVSLHVAFAFRLQKHVTAPLKLFAVANAKRRQALYATKYTVFVSDTAGCVSK